MQQQAQQLAKQPAVRYLCGRQPARPIHVSAATLMLRPAVQPDVPALRPVRPAPGMQIVQLAPRPVSRQQQVSTKPTTHSTLGWLSQVSFTVSFSVKQQKKSTIFPSSCHVTEKMKKFAMRGCCFGMCVGEILDSSRSGGGSGVWPRTHRLFYLLFSRNRRVLITSFLFNFVFSLPLDFFARFLHFFSSSFHIFVVICPLHHV